MKKLSFFKTYRQHNLALLGTTVLLLALVYSLSIRRTLTMAQQHKSMRQNIERAASAPSEIQQLRSQLNTLQRSALQSYDREQLLEAITNFCRSNDLLVTTFPEASIVQEGASHIITNEVEVEGAYTQIVRLVYLLEQGEKLGSVSSLAFFTHKNRRTKRMNLRAKITLRNLGEA